MRWRWGHQKIPRLKELIEERSELLKVADEPFRRYAPWLRETVTRPSLSLQVNRSLLDVDLVEAI